MQAVVSVIGKDRPGIIAKTSAKLYELGINIEDISQTILQEYFTMILLADLSGCEKPLSEVASILEEHGKSFGVSIRVQHEEIFDAMHKL